MISLVDTDASGIDLRCGSSRLLLFHGVVSFMTATVEQHLESMHGNGKTDATSGVSRFLKGAVTGIPRAL